jgi:radical SAM protein with 4Fe4S-binding SPASM domain
MHQPRHIYNLHIDIVHGCQLRCVGCPNSTLLPKVKCMSVADFSTILSNIDVELVHTLRLFNFGEPLLHRDLPGILAQIPKQRWSTEVVEISTNAQHVDWLKFTEALKLNVLNRLVVSCDGDGTPGEYERLRPPSKWSKLIGFLERARELRDRHSPNLQLVTRTISTLKSERDRWKEVLEPRGWTPEFRGWMVLPESQSVMTGRAVAVPPGKCFFVADAEEFTGHPWHGEIRLLYVDQDGTVVPCCMHPQAGNFGNLLKSRYSEIQSGAARAGFIKHMEVARSEMPVCGSCEMGPVGNEGPSFRSVLDMEQEQTA